MYSSYLLVVSCMYEIQKRYKPRIAILLQPIRSLPRSSQANVMSLMHCTSQRAYARAANRVSALHVQTVVHRCARATLQVPVLFFAFQDFDRLLVSNDGFASVVNNLLRWAIEANNWI